MPGSTAHHPFLVIFGTRVPSSYGTDPVWQQADKSSPDVVIIDQISGPQSLPMQQFRQKPPAPAAAYCRRFSRMRSIWMVLRRIVSRDWRSAQGNWSAMSNEITFTVLPEECGGSGHCEGLLYWETSRYRNSSPSLPYCQSVIRSGSVRVSPFRATRRVGRGRAGGRKPAERCLTSGWQLYDT